jgi:hypothetical protein
MASASALTSVLAHGSGRPRGRHHGDPGGELEAGQPGLGHGGHAGQAGQAARRGQRQRLDLAGRQLRRGGHVGVEGDRHLAADEVLHGRCAALVGHVHDVDAGGGLEHLAGEVRLVPVPNEA